MAYPQWRADAALALDHSGDPFSVTMNGKAWYAWEWLYDGAFAGIHRWFGLNGVVFFTAVIIARPLG